MSDIDAVRRAAADIDDVCAAVIPLIPQSPWYLDNALPQFHRCTSDNAFVLARNSPPPPARNAVKYYTRLTDARLTIALYIIDHLVFPEKKKKREKRRRFPQHHRRRHL